MFTGTTMRTSTIARTALLVALALVTTGLAQAASRRRDGDNPRRRGEFSIVQLRPAAGMPSGSGDTTTSSALRNNDGNGRGHKGEFSIVQLRPAAGMPTGTGDTTTASGALRNNDGNGRARKGDFSIVQIRPAAGMPTGTGDTTTASGALRSSAAGFRQTLSLSPASTASSYRLPSAGSNLATGHSRVWTSVSIDGENGLEASAGLAWTLN